MTKPYFDIEQDPVQGFWRATLRGHWTLDIVRQYSSALDAFIHDIAEGSTRKLLVDLRAMQVQTQDVAAAMFQEQRKLLALREQGKLVIALVQPESTLMMMQARRVSSAGSELVRSLFTDLRAAEEWLSQA